MNDLSITASEDAFSYYDPRICVIGLGRVGLINAIRFSEKYRTIGFDPDRDRTDELMNHHDRTSGVSEELLRRAISKGFTCTSDMEKIRTCNFYVIIVPPAAVGSGDPDLEPLWSACEVVGKVISGGDIVVYDSCVDTTFTEKTCIPILEKVSGFTCNQDFFAGYSPGPLYFGKKGFTVVDTPEVVSACSPEIAKIVDEVYTAVFTADTPDIKATETETDEK